VFEKPAPCTDSNFILELIYNKERLNTVMIRSESVDCINKDKFTLLCDETIKLGATSSKLISTKSIIVEPWVQLKCRFGCPKFGKYKTCPPHTPTYKETLELMDCYESAILIEGQPPAKQFEEMLLRIEHKANFAGFYKAFSLNAGPCPHCAECDVEGACIKPKDIRPSMEACGIDVFKTVRNNGFEIKFLEHKTEYVKYFGLILLE
jgi:predicted metal-binding protein